MFFRNDPVQGRLNERLASIRSSSPALYKGIIFTALCRVGIPDCDSPLPDSKLLIKTGALGGGKSYEELQRVAKSGKRTLILIRDHELAHQHVATLKVLGETSVAHYFSQMYKNRKTGEAVCKHHKIAKQIQKYGGKASTLCKRGGRRAAVCDAAAGCVHYQASYGDGLSARVVIAPVAMLPHKLKNHKPFDEIIYDECPILSTFVDVSLFDPKCVTRALGIGFGDIGDIKSATNLCGEEVPDLDPCDLIEAANKIVEVLSSSEKTWINFSDLPSYILIDALKRVIERAGPKGSFTGPNPHAGVEAHIRQAMIEMPRLLHRTSAMGVLDRLMSAMRSMGADGRLRSLSPCTVVKNDLGILVKVEDAASISGAFPAIEMGKFSLPSADHALDAILLTSTPADHRAYGRVYSEVVSDGAEWEHGEGTEYILVTGAVTKYSKLVGNSSDEKLSRDAQIIADIVNEEASRNNAGHSTEPHTFVFSTLAIVDRIRPHLTPGATSALHYAILPGKNAMACKPTLVLFRQPSPWPATLRLQAELLYDAPIDGVFPNKWWDVSNDFIETKESGFVSVRRNSFDSNWAMEAMRAMVMDYPFIQADRSRALVPLSNDRRKGQKSHVYLIGWEGGNNLPFKIDRTVSVQTLARDWHSQMRSLDIAFDPKAFHGRAELLSALFPEQFPDAKSASNRISHMREDFASKVAEHGFQHAWGGSIKLAGARYKVRIVFDAADVEGAAEIANSLRSCLPTDTLVHVNGIKDGIIL